MRWREGALQLLEPSRPAFSPETCGLGAPALLLWSLLIHPEVCPIEGWCVSAPAGRYLCWDRRLFSLVPVLLSLSLVIVGTRPSVENLDQAGHKVQEGKWWNKI